MSLGKMPAENNFNQSEPSLQMKGYQKHLHEERETRKGSQFSSDAEFERALESQKPSPEEPTGDQLAEGFEELWERNSHGGMDFDVEEDVARYWFKAGAAWIASRKAQKAGKI